MQGPDDRSPGRATTPAPGGRRAAATARAASKKAGPAKKSAVKQGGAAPAKKAAAQRGAATKRAAPAKTAVVRQKTAPAQRTAPAQAPVSARPPVETATRPAIRPVRDGAAARRPMPPPGQVPRRPAAPQIPELDWAYIRGLRRAVTVLLILGLCGFLLDGANRPANPRLVPATDPGAAKGAPPFGSTTLTVGSSRRPRACVLEAVTSAQLQAGLMGRTTVAPYGGMVFLFGQPSTEKFWMKGTLIPLQIAWFDAGGRYEKSSVMKPCPPTTKVCPTYGPGEPYEVALEVPPGQLKRLGIGAGSTVSLGGPCAS